MAEDERQQDELFAQYWDALADNPAAPPPANLAPALASHARQLQPPDPRAEFVARLEQQLRALPTPIAADDEAAPLLRSGLPVRPVRHPGGRIAPFFSVAAAVLLLLVGAALLAGMLSGRSRLLTSGGGPTSGDTQRLTDASEILQRAKVALNLSTVKSYVVTETLTTPELHTIKTWYQAPNLWRVETITTTARPSGDKANPQYSMQVSDGVSVWLYDPDSKVVSVNTAQSLAGAPSDPMHPYEGLASDSYGKVRNASDCYNSKLQSTESIAGRQAYVITVTGWHCQGTTAIAPPGEVLWIDSETFFVLGRAFGYSSSWTYPTDEVTSIQYNVAIDPATFTFTPPSDATVADYRPQPAPSAAEFQTEITALAKQASYPIYLPQYLPDGLVPLHMPPNAANATALTIDYAPPATASTPSANTSGMDPNGGIRINQSKPTYQSLVNMMADTTLKPTQVSGEPAWVRSIASSSSQMLAVGSEVTFFHHGTMVSVISRSYSTDELLKVAASLTAVAGGHNALPDPTLTSLLRQDAGFAVLLPTYLPSGLVVQPPQIGGRVETRYHDSNSELGLLLTESSFTSQASNQSGDPYTSSGLPLTLPNGLTAYFETAECNHGQASLYWQQDGANITLISVPTHRQSSGFSKEEMVKIAASLSKSADLGRTEPAPTNPPASLPIPDATAPTCPTPLMPASIPTP